MLYALALTAILFAMLVGAWVPVVKLFLRWQISRQRRMCLPIKWAFQIGRLRFVWWVSYSSCVKWFYMRRSFGYSEVWSMEIGPYFELIYKKGVK